MGTFFCPLCPISSNSYDRALGVERTKRLLDSQGVNLDVVDVSFLFSSQPNRSDIYMRV